MTDPAQRADACRVPIAPGLTPHGLRHSHKTQMQELGVPAVLQDGRMGHFDGSVQARYSHITPAMRHQFLAQLTSLWEAALDARLAMAAHSPVAALDHLLNQRWKEMGSGISRSTPRSLPDTARNAIQGLPSEAEDRP